MHRTRFLLHKFIFVFSVVAFSQYAHSDDPIREVGYDLAYDIHFFDNAPLQDNAGVLSESEFSRARITGKFGISDFIEAKVAMEISDEDKLPEVKDFYSTINISKASDFIAGRKKISGGMEQSLSKMDQFFFDRSLANRLFALGRYNTIAFTYNSDHWATDISGFQDDKLKEGAAKGAAVKFSWIPFQTNSSSSAVSLNLNEARPVFEKIESEFSEQIFVAGAKVFKLKVPKRELTKFQTQSIDLGIQIKRLLMQGEYFRRDEASLEQESSRSRGYYWLLSHTFGGVNREYKGDAFKSDPSRELGTEISLRYSSVELNAPDYSSTAKVLSVAASIYLTKHSKFAIQYETGELATWQYGSGTQVPNSGVLSFRMQVTY